MKTPFQITRFALFFSLVVLVLGSCKDDDPVGIETYTRNFSGEVVQDWMQIMLVLSKETTGAFPPAVARVIGYTGLALYESVVPGMPEYQSMAGQINGLSPGDLPTAEPGEYHWGAVANVVLAQMTRSCFAGASPENFQAMDDLEASYNAAFAAEVDASVMSRSIAFGQAMALAMIEYSNSDGQANCFNTNFPTSYVAPVGSGLWKPTPPLFAIALQPYWGEIRPFVTKNVTEEMPPPPIPFSTDPSSPFWIELEEVFNVNATLTTEEDIIANFWSDDPGKSSTPPGHSLSILRIVLEQENADLATSAESFAKLGMAVHDAFISCWKAKYIYNLIRPITVVHEHVDPSFSIPLPTPPFPEYTSGHSVQSGAAAKVLTDLFGDNYAFTDVTQVFRSDIDGSARSFSSFYAFADEAAISRLYGGIHYRKAIDEGIAQGLGVGENISALHFKK